MSEEEKQELVQGLRQTHDSLIEYVERYIEELTPVQLAQTCKMISVITTRLSKDDDAVKCVEDFYDEMIEKLKQQTK